MPQIKFDLQKIKSGDKSEVIKYSDKVRADLETGKANFSLGSVLPSLMVDEDFNHEFTHNLNQELGYKPSQGVEFDITSTTVNDEISTDVMDTVEALIKDTSMLQSVKVHDFKPNQFKQLFEYGVEKDAVNLAEQASGTDADETFRTDDLLIAKTKVQASSTITELAITTFDAIELATLTARLIRRVQTKLIGNILYAGNGVANGTARTAGTFRGIMNNYGVNGVGDLSNYIGAVSYATKAAADTALGTASSDAYDLCVKVKRQLLPNNLSDVMEEDYVFIMNRTTWGKISTVVDANGRYKARSAIDPATGKVVKQIDYSNVVLNTECLADEVFLVPLRFYNLALSGGIKSLTDNGVVELREGNILYVTRTYGDGSMLYGQKYLETTDATIGTTAINNQQQNAFRNFKIV